MLNNEKLNEMNNMIKTSMKQMITTNIHWWKE